MVNGNTVYTIRRVSASAVTLTAHLYIHVTLKYFQTRKIVRTGYRYFSFYIFKIHFSI
jgi:hypothetical protein